MKKKRNIGFVYFLAFIFLVLCIFGGLGFYNNAITGATINPASDFSIAVSNLIKDNETVSVILTFVMLLSLFFVLVEKTHVFKDNKKAGIIFSSAATLIAIIFTPLVDWMLYLVSYAFWATIFVTFLIIFFAAYLFLHKNVSEGIGVLAGVASRRDQRRAGAMGSKGEKISAKREIISGKSIFRDEKAKLAWKAKLLGIRKKIDKQIKSLNATAVAKGKHTDPDIINLLDNLKDDVVRFKSLINSEAFIEADQLYTSIGANISRLNSLIKKK